MREADRLHSRNALFCRPTLAGGRLGAVYLLPRGKLTPARVSDTFEGGCRLESGAFRTSILLNLQQNLAVQMAVDGELS